MNTVVASVLCIINLTRVWWVSFRSIGYNCSLRGLLWYRLVAVLSDVGINASGSLSSGNVVPVVFDALNRPE